MKKMTKLFSLLLVLVMAVSVFAGCAKTTTTTAAPGETTTTAAVTTTAAQTGDYDFYIFNTKGENADALQAAVDAYAAKTGQKIKCFSLGAGTASGDTLATEMNSEKKPSIFSIMNLQELAGWKEGGYALDLTKATEPSFKAMHDAVAQGLRLTTDGVNSYGIPYNVEGYGYVVDKKMVADLFGEANVTAWLASFKTATYAEFEAAVKTIAAYIKDGTAGTVTLSGKGYALNATKGELAKSLNGVFATAGSQKWTYGDHFINIAVDAVFANPAAAAGATDIADMKGALVAYAKALDLKTSNAAGLNGALPRGPEFINTTTAGYDQSVQIFVEHKGLFLKQGNWVFTNMEKIDPDKKVTPNLTFLPVKMPFAQADIKAAGLTVDHMLSSIPVFVPNYYAINAKVPQAEQEKAEKFLVWLNTDPEGQKFIVENMAFIPYNADPAKTTLPNSLGQSILEYMQTNNTLTNAYAGAPTGWAGEVVGLKVMEDYLTKATWSEKDYTDIADYAIAQWKELKNQ